MSFWNSPSNLYGGMLGAGGQQPLSNSGYQNAAWQNGQLGLGNVNSAYQNQNVGTATASYPASIKSPGYEMPLDECADLWETHFGDRWVQENSLGEYRIIATRLSSRGWMEPTLAQEGSFLRLVPEKYRR